MNVMELERAREAAGVTKSELARRLGIPVRNVRRMENNAGYDPRFSRVQQIAAALGVPIDSLVPERAHGSTLPPQATSTPPTQTSARTHHQAKRGDRANHTGA